MMRIIKRIAGWSICFFAGLLMFSCSLSLVLSVVFAVPYDSLGERFFCSALYLALAVGFFKLLRFGWKLVRSDSTKQAVRTETMMESKQVIPEKKDFPDDIDDDSYIAQITHGVKGPWQQYLIKLAARPYGWESMVDWASYAAQKEFAHVDQVTASFSAAGQETVLTDSYRQYKTVKDIPELKQEGAMLSVAGASTTLKTMMKIFWYNQTNTLAIYTTVEDEDLMNRFVETLVRRTFGTDQAMAKAREQKKAIPVTVTGNKIDLHSCGVSEWFAKNTGQYELCGSIKLEEQTPSIILCEDGRQVHEYVLQTADDEDFSGQYFQYSVRINMVGSPRIPGVQIDGFIAESEDITDLGERPGYRFEGYFPDFAAEEAQKRRNALEGRDLYEKGLRYQGYTTPGNVRLVGICTYCGKSITFKGYSYHLMQLDPLYSDDGLSVIPCEDPEFDKENGSVEKDGKTYRFYNSFCCNHCGKPYIDYAAHHEMKKFGVLGCSYKL